MHELATKLKELKTETDVVDVQEAIQKAIDKVEEKIGEKAVEKKEAEKKECYSPFFLFLFFFRKPKLFKFFYRIDYKHGIRNGY